ncbi:MAG: helix-turn-helix domain-containing protein, partial [Actinomycetota bacterium]
TQTQVAAAMGTSQSAVAKLEVARTDPRLSTVSRFALAAGCPS